MESLISVVVPCYNVAQYIPNLLNSILAQDYPNVEIICVNDGSTDNTRDVLYSFSDEFNKKGYEFNVITKDNGGLCSAINTGLQYVHGEFLIWPDADDWYETNTVFSDVVKTFKERPNCNCVRFIPRFIDEDGNTKSIECTGLKKESLFEDFVFSTKNVWLPAGSHVVRTKTLFKYYPDRHIYDSKYIGQNIQLLAPCAYNSKVITLGGGKI